MYGDDSNIGKWLQFSSTQLMNHCSICKNSYSTLIYPRYTFMLGIEFEAHGNAHPFGGNSNYENDFVLQIGNKVTLSNAASDAFNYRES